MRCNTPSPHFLKKRLRKVLRRKTFDNNVVKFLWSCKIFRSFFNMMMIKLKVAVETFTSFLNIYMCSSFSANCFKTHARIAKEDNIEKYKHVIVRTFTKCGWFGEHLKCHRMLGCYSHVRHTFK